MAVTKRVILKFADSKIKAIDHIHDLRRATENASLNLNLRYNVVLQYPMPTDDDQVYLDIRIPDELAESFSYGKRLRGISNYLLSTRRDFYEQHLVGNRLLTYIVVDEEPPRMKKEHPGPSMAERLEAVADFAKLLERSDDEALILIGDVLRILKISKNPIEE